MLTACVDPRMTDASRSESELVVSHGKNRGFVSVNLILAARPGITELFLIKKSGIVVPTVCKDL